MQIEKIILIDKDFVSAIALILITICVGLLLIILVVARDRKVKESRNKISEKSDKNQWY